MEYVIECRLSPTVTRSLGMRDVFSPAPEAILFAYAFSTEEETASAKEAAEAAAETLSNLVREYPGYRTESGYVLLVEPGEVTGESGSVILTIILIGVAIHYAPIAGVAAVGLISSAEAAAVAMAASHPWMGLVALWAAREVGGGVLGEWGKEIAEKVRKARSPKPPASSIRNPQQIADEQAQSMAREHKGTATRVAGGELITRPDGRKAYKYKYDVDVDGRPDKGSITVFVDREATQPPDVVYTPPASESLEYQLATLRLEVATRDQQEAISQQMVADLKKQVEALQGQTARLNTKLNQQRIQQAARKLPFRSPEEPSATKDPEKPGEPHD